MQMAQLIRFKMMQWRLIAVIIHEDATSLFIYTYYFILTFIHQHGSYTTRRNNFTKEKLN